MSPDKLLWPEAISNRDMRDNKLLCLLWAQALCPMPLMALPRHMDLLDFNTQINSSRESGEPMGCI